MSHRPPRILYLDSHDHATCLEKFAGARRFADAVGWSTPRKKITNSPTRVSALLARLKPDGCLVNATRLMNALPPAAFGSTPVVYLDTDTRLFGHTCCVVAHDSDATGRSILEEIQNTRLEFVRNRLARGSLSIQSLTDFCGYRTPQALRKAFKRHTGMSMAEWRKRQTPLFADPD